MNFVEYTRQALRKLSLPDEQVSDRNVVTMCANDQHTAHRFRNKLLFITVRVQ